MRFRRKSLRPPKEIEKLEISGKTVYVFEDHAAALAAWAEERRRLPAKPILITLDTHTDTLRAFTRLIYYRGGEPEVPKDIDQQSLQLCGTINYEDRASIAEAVEKLGNDEQIDCAIKTGVIEAAFVISYRAGVPTEPREGGADGGDLKYDVPGDRMFILPVAAGFEPDQDLSSDENFRRHCDLAIESEYLGRKLEIGDKMAEALGKGEATALLDKTFILDIDLDYFRTERAISPVDASVFYKLIRRAAAVTVAQEPHYVEMEKFEGEKITSEFLWSKLKDHIVLAMKGE